MKLNYLVILLSTVTILFSACNEPEPSPTPFPTVTDVALMTSTPKSPTPTPISSRETQPIEPTDQPSPTPEPTEELSIDLVDKTAADIGVVNITGVVTYTAPFFTLGVAAPVIILEDQAGFVDRNEGFLMPVESQTLGQITSDFFTSPFSFNISLPVEPQGTLKDVDNDGEVDTGVQIFAIAYWTNTFGDPFLEERDLFGGGWSTAYASTRISDDAKTEKEIVGGKLLVYAPDNEQAFPVGFGDDGLLFTDDDPTSLLLKGYTVINMDNIPFTFDRDPHQVINLIEPEGAALVDYSDLSYTSAFDNLVAQLKNEYAFTEYKGIDWDALHAEFGPQFVTADERNNADLYRKALRDFAWSIPDGHVSGPFLVEEFQEAAGGGIGIAIRELDDGRVLVNFLLEGSPASVAGIQLGAEILAINGVNITEAISNTNSYFGPYSTAHNKRLDQLLFSTRFPVGTEVEISFLNPGFSSPQIANIIASVEIASFNFWFKDSDRDGFELPVEYELLESGIGYVQIFSFSDNSVLTVQLWERMIQAMNENDVPALIVDMRQNGGGRGFLADQMAAYFFDEPLVLGNSGAYDEDRGEFYFDPEHEDHFYLPAEELRYHGELVVLVGPDCASACEFFSYDMTLQDRAIIIGQYPTAGLGGGVDEVAMPENERFRFTQGRAVNAEGKIHIEGIGVVPDVHVPVDEVSLFSEGDPVLDAAVIYLAGNLIDGGEIRFGDEITVSLAQNIRIRYSLALEEGDVVSIILESETDMILGFYDQEDEFLGSQEGKQTALESFEVPFDFVLVIEVAAVDSESFAEFNLRIINDSE